VSHVAVRVQSEGQVVEGRVIQKSDRADFDEMSLGAVRGGAPYPVPPRRLLDGAGSLAFNVEFVCDCAQRAASTAAR